MEKALYLDGKWEAQVREYYEMITAKLLKEKAYKIAEKNQVDIIRDIGNLTHVHFVSEMFALPLKTEAHPLGVFTEHELYLIMVALYLTVFFDIDPVSSYPLRVKARSATQMLGELIEANVREISVGGVFNRLMSAIFPDHSPLRLRYQPDQALAQERHGYSTTCLGPHSRHSRWHDSEPRPALCSSA